MAHSESPLTVTGNYVNIHPSAGIHLNAGEYAVVIQVGSVLTLVYGI